MGTGKLDQFLQAISYSYGDAAVDQVGAIFSRFGLPIPEKEEFYAGNHNGCTLPKQIVFLESHGIAFRFYEAYEIPRHDFILQPVFKYEIEHMHFDIVPIIKTGITGEDCEYLTRQLRQDGISWSDSVCHNAGYLPDIEFAHPVIVDVCDSIERHEVPYSHYALYNFCSVQTELFEPLLDAADDYKLAKETPDAAAEFLKACREFKGSKSHGSLLQESFNCVQDDGQTQRAWAAAKNYDVRLKALALA